MLLLYERGQTERIPRNRLAAGCLAIGRAARRVITRISRCSVRPTMKGSRRARRLLIASEIVCHPWEYVSRQTAAKVLATRPPGIRMRSADGFVRFGESDFNEASRIVRLCQQIYFDEKLEMVKAPPPSTAKQKKYLVELLSDEDLVRYPQLVDFCLSPPVVEAVSRYLGTVPVLRRVGLWLSFPAPTHGASRLFHLDPEDFTQVRLFLNVINISKPQGPLTFLPADVSESVLAQLWRDEKKSGVREPEYRRWTDEEIFARSRSRDCVDLAGPPGSGVFLDTSRCLHFGSRMEPGTVRLVFHAQFLRYHFAYSCSANRFDRTLARGDAIRSRLLAQRPGMPVISASSRVDPEIVCARSSTTNRSTSTQTAATMTPVRARLRPPTGS